VGVVEGILVVLVSGFVGGWLKARADDFGWRRQQQLDAHLALIEAADKFAAACAALFTLGTLQRDKDWLSAAAGVRALLADVDRIGGRVRLVSSHAAAMKSLEIYVQCREMFLGAIREPAMSEGEFQNGPMKAMVSAYHGFINQARKDLSLADLVFPGRQRPSFAELAEKRMKELQKPAPELPAPEPPANPGAAD
jgi:hypothetical protein